MRDKEAIDIERKNVIRNLEKQAKVIDRLVECEKNLNTQVVSCVILVSQSMLTRSLRVNLKRRLLPTVERLVLMVRS